MQHQEQKPPIILSKRELKLIQTIRSAFPAGKFKGPLEVRVTMNQRSIPLISIKLNFILP